MYSVIIEGFKPCYKWNTFNTIIGYSKNLGGSKF